MENKMATGKATHIAHWPGQDVAVCDNHSTQIVSLGRNMGFAVSLTPVAESTVCACVNCANEQKKNRHWVIGEDMDKLCLEGSGVRNVHKDAEGNFWFNDETESQVYGPYISAEEAVEGCAAYAQTL
jgi:hypothetical protein